MILDQTQVRLLGLWLMHNGRWQITFHQALPNQNIHDHRPNNFAHLDTRQVPRNELDRRSKPTPQIDLLLAGLTAVFRDGRPLFLTLICALQRLHRVVRGRRLPNVADISVHLIVSYE